MFCPNCKVEYRSGFTRCSDCDVKLVSDLPTENEPEGSFSEPELTVIWEGEEQSTCVHICKQLQAERIRYEVAQIFAGRHGRAQVDWRYKIGVLPTDAERAKEVIGPAGVVDFPDPDELDGPSPLELPDDQEHSVPDTLKRDWTPEN